MCICVYVYTCYVKGIWWEWLRHRRAGITPAAAGRGAGEGLARGWRGAGGHPAHIGKDLAELRHDAIENGCACYWEGEEAGGKPPGCGEREALAHQSRHGPPTAQKPQSAVRASAEMAHAQLG